MNKHHILQYLILFTILFGGCMHVKPDNSIANVEIPSGLPSDINDSGNKIGKAVLSTSEVSKEQRKLNAGIGSDAKAVQASDRGKFTKQTSSILNLLDKSDKVMTNLDKTTKELSEIRISLTVSQATSKKLEENAINLKEIGLEQEQEITSLKEDNTKLQQELDESTKKFLNKIFALLIGLGILAIGVSAYSAWGAIQMGSSPLKAVGYAIGGVTITCSSIGFMYYSESIGKIIIIVIAVCAASIVGKVIIDLKRRNEIEETIELQKKTIDYNTRLTENIKTSVMDDTQKEKWFGTRHTNGIAGTLQGDPRVYSVIDESRSRMESLDSVTVTHN